MRKSYALLVLIPFGILAACEDSEDAGGLPLNLDGGQPVVDGAVTPPPPPPPSADGGDAADAGPLPVTVTVTNAAGPEANVPVVFQDATGAVLATVMTSAFGVAAQVVPAGSQVTVVMGSAAEPRLMTITEVEPGDVLATVDLPTPSQYQTAMTSVPDGGPASATLQPHAGRCSGNYGDAPPLDIYVSPDCQFAGNFPVLLLAYDGDSNDELAFTFKKANVTGETDAGAPIDVNITEPWSTTFRTHTISVTNVPSGVGLDTTFSEVASGVARPGRDGFYNEGSEAATFETQHVGHPGYPDFIQSEIMNYHGSNSQLSVSAIATREAAPTGAATTTFNYADMLPYVENATIDETTSERPSVTWTVEDGKSLDTADGAYVLVRWNTYENEGYRPGRWTFVTPANRKTVKAPQLPANLSAFAPPAADAGADFGFQSPPIVTVVEGSAINGYSDLRKITASEAAAAALRWSDNNSGTLIPPVAAGTLRATAFTHDND